MNPNSHQQPTIPLTAPDRQWVKNIAIQSGCEGEKLKTLIKNLLAVRAIAHWLDIYGIPYAWEKSYCSQPLMHLNENCADLYLAGLGRLECRATTSNQRTVAVEPEAWTDRLGYVVVQLQDDLQDSQLLGFVETVRDGVIFRDQLQPIEGLFGVFAAVELQNAPVNSLNQVAETIQAWLSRALDNAWQVGDFYFGQPSFAPVRSQTTVRKVIAQLQNTSNEASKQRLMITLGELAQTETKGEAIATLVNILRQSTQEDTRWLAASTLARLDPKHPQAAHRLRKTLAASLSLLDNPLELNIALMPSINQEIDAIIEVGCANSQQQLPNGLQLSLWSAENELIDEISVTASQGTPKNYLKMTLEIEPGTDFRVQLSLGAQQVSELIHL
ncbi:hypothetical protein AWQ21_15520 (plasmid) [Picosynechococcus sp. PCC 7003]|uniref:DUF1822 family protein n=1 Tax=Picosynechococcus sp. PCC 7003 TaxID=374981 RepID=UPI000810AA45|nr:DUF1822 family protein [Picosynechococcus sp. PCC 7003]ANV85934.1 hypothetical protein AWQ21_15520 [Picosynechococcus sp. PCC 7003]